MDKTALVTTINTFYDRALTEGLSLDKIGFLNVGYWKGVEHSIEVAQIQLIETLVSFFANRDGNILDVACGTGASSRFLTKYFQPKKITGINISARQLDMCKSIAPQCNFRLMDATDMTFAESSFDNVLCIEAAVCFLTRQKFLEEAYRVLKPAGRLAMLDFLCDYDLVDGTLVASAGLPKENYLPDLDAYRDSLIRAGFKYVRVDECTEYTTDACWNHLIRVEEMKLGKGDDREVLEFIRRARVQVKAFRPGCMVYAMK